MALDLLLCMKSFTVVAKYKGFSAAARELHISTPVLTKQIKRLEDFIGKKLLERTTRQVSLTEEGQTYLEHVQYILNDVQNARNAVYHLEQEPHGKLTIGIPGALNSKYFLNIIQEFLKKYPKVHIHTTDENSPSYLLNGLLDLVITELKLQDKKLNSEYLFTIRRGIFVAPQYIKKYGKPKTISDLKNHNCLIYNPLSPCNEWIFANNKKIKIHGNYSSVSGMNIIQAAITGIGLISCPTLLVEDELKSKKLVEVKLENKPNVVKIHLYYRPVHQNSPTKLMIDYILKTIPKKIK